MQINRIIERERNKHCIVWHPPFAAQRDDVNVRINYPPLIRASFVTDQVTALEIFRDFPEPNPPLRTEEESWCSTKSHKRVGCRPRRYKETGSCSKSCNGSSEVLRRAKFAWKHEIPAMNFNVVPRTRNPHEQVSQCRV